MFAGPTHFSGATFDVSVAESKDKRRSTLAVTTRMLSMAAASEYVLEPIRDSAEFTLYRGRQRGNPSPVLAVAPTAEQPLPQSLRRLEHEYSLAAELEPAWAAKPLALTRHEGRTILVLADPGGEPLDLIFERGGLEREQRLDLARVSTPRDWLGNGARPCPPARSDPQRRQARERARRVGAKR